MSDDLAEVDSWNINTWREGKAGMIRNMGRGMGKVNKAVWKDKPNAPMYLLATSGRYLGRYEDTIEVTT